jgi:hypothetical protein
MPDNLNKKNQENPKELNDNFAKDDHLAITIANMISEFFPGIVQDKHLNSSELSIRLWVGGTSAFIFTFIIMSMFYSFLLMLVPFARECKLSQGFNVKQEICTTNPFFSNLVLLGSTAQAGNATYNGVKLLRKRREKMME